MAIFNGFNAVKVAAISALLGNQYQHEAREDINVKNLLATGEVSAAYVATLLKKAKGFEHTCEPHHSAFKGVDVHLIKTQGWYIKFYFLDPETMFVSVHQ